MLLKFSKSIKSDEINQTTLYQLRWLFWGNVHP